MEEVIEDSKFAKIYHDVKTALEGKESQGKEFKEAVSSGSSILTTHSNLI